MLKSNFENKFSKIDKREIDYIHFDNEIGFTSELKLSDDLQHKLDPDNRYNLLTIFQGTIDKNKLEFEKSNIVPAHFKIALCDKQNSDLIMIDSSLFNSSIKLLNFAERNKYYVKKTTGQLYKKKGRDYIEINPREIFEDLHKIHLNSKFRGKNRFTNIKWFILKIIFLFFKILTAIFKYLYLFITGKKLTLAESFLTTTQFRQQVIKEETVIKKEIGFFNIKANIIPIVSYSFLHLVGYIIFYTFRYKPQIFTTILMNNFLTVIYVIVTYFTYEYIIGSFIKWITVCFCFIKNKFNYRKNTK